MSDDLVAFIEARLRDEEAEALAATPGPWRYNPGKQWLQIENKALRDAAARAGVQGEEFVGAGPLDATVGVAATGPADHPQSMADARFIARHDPSRVLRELAAKRAILARYVDALDVHSESESRATDDRYSWGWATWYVEALGPVVRQLALPYSDHPDFRPEWSPDA